MRQKRRLGLLLLILAVLVVLAWPLEEWALGRVVQRAVSWRLNGSFRFGSWHLSPRRLVISGLLLKNRSGEIIAQAHTLEVLFSPWRLITAGYVPAITRVTLEEPTIGIHLDAKGVSDWANLVRAPKSPPPARKLLPVTPVPLPFSGIVLVHKAALEFTDQPRQGFSARLEDANIRLAGDGSGRINLEIDARDSDPAYPTPISILGWFDTAPPGMKFRFRARQFNLAHWGNWATNAPTVKLLGGGADMDVLVFAQADTWDAFSAANAQFQGAIKISKASVHIDPMPGSFDDISGWLILATNHLGMKDLTGRYLKSRLLLTGTIHDYVSPRLELEVTSPSARMEDVAHMLSAVVPLPVAGPGGGRVRIQGTGAQLVYDVQINAAPLRVKGETLSSARVAFRVDADSLQVREARGAWQGGEVSGNGYIFFSRPSRLALRMSGRGLPARSLERLVGIKAAGTGVGSFDASLTGTTSAPLVMGKARLDQATLPVLGQGGLSGAFCYSPGSLVLWDTGWSSSTGSFLTSGMIKLTKDPGLALTLRAQNVPFAGAVPWPGAGISGNLEGAGYLAGPLSSLSAYGSLGSGALSLGNLKGSLAGVNIGINQGQLLVNGNLDLASGRAGVLGLIPLSSSQPLALLVSSSSQDWSQVSSAFPLGMSLAGKGALSLFLEGDPGQGYRVDLAAGLGKGNLSLLGRFGAGSGAPWMVHGLTRAFPLSALDLSPPGRLKIQGNLDADLLVFGNGQNWRSEGFGTLRGRVLGLPVNRLFLSARGNRTGFMLDPAVIGGPLGTLALRGLVSSDRKTYDLSWDLRALDLGQASKTFDFRVLGLDNSLRNRAAVANLGGTGWASGTLRGPWSAPVVLGSAEVLNGMVNYASYALSGGFRMDSGRLSFKNLDLRMPPGDYRINGQVALDGGALNLTFHTRQGQLTRLLALTPWSDLPLRGLMEGDLSIGGTMKTPLLNGTLVLTEVELGNQPLDRISATFNSQGKTLRLDPLEIRLEGAVVHGKGYITSTNQMNFELVGHDFPLERLNFLAQTLAPLKGNGDFSFHVTGSLDQPEVKVDFAATDLLVRGTPLTSATGSFTWDKHRLVMSPLSATGPAGFYNLVGEIDYTSKDFPTTWPQWNSPAGPSMALKGEVNNGDLAAIMAFLGRTSAAPLSGRWNGTFSINGRLPSPAWSLDLSGGRTVLGRTVFDNVRASISGGNDQWKITQISFSGPGGSGEISGGWQVDGPVSLNGQVSGLDLNLFAPFTPWGDQLAGRLDMTLTAGGSIQIPNIDANFMVHQGGWRNFLADSVSGLLSVREGRVELSDITVKVGKYTALVQGEIPLVLAGGRLYSTAPMSLRATFKDNLSLLKLVLPGLVDTSGDFTGDLALTGMWPEVVLLGDTTIKKGSLTFESFNPPISAIEAQVAFADNHAQLKHFTGNLGPGQFSISGGMDFNGLLPVSTDLALSGRSLTLAAPNYFSGVIDADIYLKGPFSSPLLGGRVSSSLASLQLPTAAKEFKSTETTGSTPVHPPTAEETLSGIFFPTWAEFRPRATLLDPALTVPGPGPAETMVWSAAPLGLTPVATTNPVPAEVAGAPVAKEGFPLRFDLNLTAQKDVWLRLAVPALSASLNTSGTLHVGGDLSQPKLEGQTQLDKGDITALNATFKLSEGYILFTGSGWIPLVYLQTETNVNDVQVYLDVRGPANDPTIELSSSPAMSREKLMALLSQKFFGTGTDTQPALSGTQALTRTFSYLLVSSLLEQVTQTIGRTFALNEVNLDQSVLGNYSITLGKALDAKERFLITYTRVFTGEGQTSTLWGIEYRLARNFLLRLAEDETSKFFFWIQGRFLF